MSALRGILKEELVRLSEAERSFKVAIAKLPKGSLQKKKIKGVSYFYLARRKGSRIVYEYLGNLEKADLKKLENEIGLRRRYERQLRNVRGKKEQLRRVVHGKRGAI